MDGCQEWANQRIETRIPRSYSAFQVIELHHSLLPTPHSPSHLWSKYLKNAVSYLPR
ncbi:hypothetical protein [Nostoc sp. CHAB 5715]|uniref:hypothetical protein n=1 Tax=Nostoc sp. CHAB 5715 TaxID=2780400 RepID=UPI001E5DE682|nr:hypothetical protein [Nostoc sp. CHAB 5715]